MSLNALKPDSDDGGSAIISDDKMFVAGAECDCPIACDETVYSQELSIADLRADSVFFDRLTEEVENELNSPPDLTVKHIFATA